LRGGDGSCVNDDPTASLHRPSPTAINVGGLFVAVQSRGEYLDEQRRKAAMPQEDET